MSALHPTPKQQQVLDYMFKHPAESYSVEEILGVGAPKGGYDNQAAFIMRMLVNDQLRLVPGCES